MDHFAFVSTQLILRQTFPESIKGGQKIFLESAFVHIEDQRLTLTNGNPRNQMSVGHMQELVQVFIGMTIKIELVI